MRARNDSVLAEVFVCIEEHYAEAISFKEVAVAVSLSPSYLTTVLRERTGRTVVEEEVVVAVVVLGECHETPEEAQHAVVLVVDLFTVVVATAEHTKARENQESAEDED